MNILRCFIKCTLYSWISAHLLCFFLLSFYRTLIFWHNAFRSHADRQALLQSALLALAAHIHIDLAAIAILALVYGVPSDATSKETFAAFTRQGIVVVTGRTITAYKTQFFLLARRGSFPFLRVASFAIAASIAAATSATIVTATTSRITAVAVYRTWLRQFIPT